ncbi:MAG: DUF3224 domain-containing protein [Acidobacteriaceae bacterium]|nr:DUF3224 domain-containing protein [Acidobacteriaceae bacterium]
MSYNVRGTFTANIEPLDHTPAEGISRFSLEKQFRGGLEGVSKGEMMTAGDPKLRAAGYVAMELVTGKLETRNGSFALQHLGTMDGNGRKLSVVIVPGSGTGELKGIQGTLQFEIAGEEHSYSLEYTLPQ